MRVFKIFYKTLEWFQISRMLSNVKLSECDVNTMSNGVQVSTFYKSRKILFYGYLLDKKFFFDPVFLHALHLTPFCEFVVFSIIL